MKGMQFFFFFKAALLALCERFEIACECVPLCVCRCGVLMSVNGTNACFESLSRTAQSLRKACTGPVEK